MMKSFFKKILLFFILFLFSLFIISIFVKKNFQNVLIHERDVFFKKIDFFNNFINKNDSINLILGSSLAESAIIPDSLGAKWFSFTNPAQNIYESYKFIDHFKSIINIDTIIVVLQPFDFPRSFINNRMNSLPFLNGNFHLFGKDSITLLKNSFKYELQIIKSKNFPSIFDILENNNRKDYKVWTSQGFSGRINKVPINIDSLYYSRSKPMFNHLKYFYGLKSPINMKYFDLFNDLSTKISGKVIYLFTPKSKPYHIDLVNNNLDKLMLEIIDSLNYRDISVLNFEHMDTDRFNFHWYFDETHNSYNGAKNFTKILKDRLKK